MLDIFAVVATIVIEALKLDVENYLLYLYPSNTYFMNYIRTNRSGGTNIINTNCFLVNASYKSILLKPQKGVD